MVKRDSTQLEFQKSQNPTSPKKQGMFMSTNCISPIPSLKTAAQSGIIPDQFINMPANLVNPNNFRTKKSQAVRNGNNSMMDRHVFQSLGSPSSICESYKNVDFFTITENLNKRVMRNKFSQSPQLMKVSQLHLLSEQKLTKPQQ